MTYKIGSLFSGIGGFEIGLEKSGIGHTVWQVEINEYCRNVLKKHWPTVTRYEDIRKLGKGLEYGSPEQVDLLCGGFPCQDISYAGDGKGLDGERSGLWYEYLRLIEEIKPKIVLAENVSALRTRGLDEILRGLAAVGYDAEWHCIPASYIGALHRRDRMWIIAYPAGTVDGSIMGHADSQFFHFGHGTGNSERDSTIASGGKMDTCNTSGGNLVANADSTRLERYAGNGGHAQQQTSSRHPSPSSLRSRRKYLAQQWQVEPNVGRVAYGVPALVDRLKCLGNAIVPQVAEFIGYALIDYFNNRISYDRQETT